MTIEESDGVQRATDHRAMPVCGYVEPWSLRAGAAASLHLSGIDPHPELRIVRLDRPDGAAPGWRIERQAEPVSVQPMPRGAWIEIPLPAARIAGGVWTLRVECLFTANATPRPVLSLGDVGAWLAGDGRIALGAPAAEARTPQPVPPWRWLTLALRLRPGGVALEIAGPGGSTLELPCPPGWRPPSGIRLGATADAAGPTLNARFARIDLHVGDAHAAGWRFPPRKPVAILPPALGEWPALRLHNAPTFCVTSPRWTGDVHDPRLDAAQYDAVHCHEGDMAPLAWPECARLVAPDDAPSGVYAVQATTERGAERIPFFVRPARRRASLAFLAPTLTYLAYADEHLPRDRFAWLCEDRGHAFAQDNGLLSLYDTHADGSGVSLTTTRRPKSTLRDNSVYPLSGCPHLLPVDLRLLRFCHGEGIAFDLLTDHDLHAQGAAALAGYDGVFTGSHPEYWTTPMQDALAALLDRGGSLAYLGGNGFMWVAAIDGDVAEVRRGHTLAARTWNGRPGEINLALSGEIGGLWRERGRSEFALAGTGMTMMGFGPARPYRRTQASFEPAHAWVFEGVAEEVFGDAGVVLGGAAGYEVDRTDPALGTPPGTAVLATAAGFDASYQVDGNDWFATDQARAAARRADMAVRMRPDGGFVFAAGSVAWCGALPDPGADNAVGRITANVLRRLIRLA